MKMLQTSTVSMSNMSNGKRNTGEKGIEPFFLTRRSSRPADAARTLGLIGPPATGVVSTLREVIKTGEGGKESALRLEAALRNLFDYFGIE